MVSIELLNDDEKGAPRSPLLMLEGPKEKAKRKRRTAEQIAENARMKLEKDLEVRREKAKAAAQKKNEKRKEAKTKRVKNRNAARGTIKERVLHAALQEGLPFANEDIKIPLKGAKLDKVQDYLRAAKARYYKREKLPNSITRRALELAAVERLNPALIKRTAKAKNVNAILAAARKKASKNTDKTQRIQQRQAIMERIMGEFNLATEKDVQKIVCYRAASERKK